MVHGMLVRDRRAGASSSIVTITPAITGHERKAMNSETTKMSAPRALHCYSVDAVEPPKDGTRILLFIRCHGWVTACWETTAHEMDDDYAIWCVDDFKHGPYAIRGYSSDQVTHWMPLPDTPSA